jgi:Glycosyltransferase family 87
VVAAAVSAALALAPAAPAQAPSAPGSTTPRIDVSESLPDKPGGYELGPREAIRIANRDSKVQQTRERWDKLEATAEAELPSTWKIGYVAEGSERAQVLVDDPTGTVRESWTGYQVAWQMARGYEGSFGHLLNAPYVWIPLSALFFFGLFDFRRPRRIVHLDLLVLLSFSISQIFFNAANIGLSVPLSYPPLVYLLVRMLWVGFRGPGEGLRPTVPVAWLAIATCFLLGFRIALNVADSGVIDVGYSGVIGADRIAHGERLYGEDAFPDDNPFGDTYGPVNYYAYVPFEFVLGWSGDWDELPAAHAAAVGFDLLTVGLLFLLGRRLRPGPQGTNLGVILAFAWTAFPYTDYVLQSNANDTLVAALVVGALLLIASPPARGAMAAIAGLTKFAPLALAPLLAAGPRAGIASEDPETGDAPLSRRRLRALALFGVGFAGAAALVLLQPLLDSGLPTFFERTIQNQVDRDSPFSVWGQVPGLGWLQVAAQVAAACLAVLVAFLPRRRTLPQIAALAAVVLIAAQLTADHWFYLYIVWFLPGLFAALSVGKPEPPPPERPEPGTIATPLRVAEPQRV